MTKEECGVAKTLKIIGQRWTILILRDLLEGEKRFGQLQKSLAGISPRTLALRLQQLEQDGILNKHIFLEMPPHVEYTLTSKGQSLNKVISDMRTWGENN